MAELKVFTRLAGKFIVLDGLDGSGKSTQLDMLEQSIGKAGGRAVRVREPGGTTIGEHIREVLLSSKGEGMDIRAEMLLYMASRAQLVQERIKPALAAGQTVLSDRFLSSTLAYQGSAGGLPLEAILDVGKVALDGVWPDLTIILDLPVEEAMARLQSPSKGKKTGGLQAGLFQDRIERRVVDYHRRVREGFVAQAASFPDCYRVISALDSKAKIQANIVATLAEFLPA